MTHDFAKQRRSAPEPTRQTSPGTWFLMGLLTGSFATFLVALWLFVPEPEETAATKPVPGEQVSLKDDEIQWDFYEIFPKSEVPIVEEYNDAGEKVTTDMYAWILQAGSFQDANDADELRAELLLLGLDASVQKVKVDKETWHRVIVGPYNTELERNRAQDRLAQAEIRVLPVRISR